ncbi:MULTISPECIES: PRD domain-containing protein [Exiguobacterium]|uniref:PRD domain-containing protein n=1 Tax=unclassified Exiguobacterium TaxID=2644629 RepID=UPI000690F7B0|nr:MULTISPECIES: PRD domain-containing protein [unclassified Exiguobacterium]
MRDVKITQKFVLEQQASVHELEALLQRIDVKDIELAGDILQFYETEVGNTVNNMALLGLGDHINFAVEHARKGMNFRSALEWEIKQLYAKEYSVASAEMSS